MGNEQSTFLFNCGRGNLIAVKEHLPVDGVDGPVSNLGHTGLMEAAKNGRVDVCEFLLEMKADATRTDTKGVTALAMAAYKGSAPVIKLLLEHKADVNAQSNLELVKFPTAFAFAASKGNLNAMVALVEAKADIRTDDLPWWTYNGACLPRNCLLACCGENAGESLMSYAHSTKMFARYRVDAMYRYLLGLGLRLNTYPSDTWRAAIVNEPVSLPHFLLACAFVFPVPGEKVDKSRLTWKEEEAKTNEEEEEEGKSGVEINVKQKDDALVFLVDHVIPFAQHMRSVLVQSVPVKLTDAALEALLEYSHFAPQWCVELPILNHPLSFQAFFTLFRRMHPDHPFLIP